MKDKTIPAQVKAIIIGGGIAGCSVAYHLAKQGWTDVLLLERKQLTCGTTWHAAGLLPRFRPSKNMSALARYSHELYSSLEKQTGMATGYKRTGSIVVALTNERMEELRRQVSAAKVFETPAEEISTADIRQRYPELAMEGVIGGVWFEKDATVDPVNLTRALAKAAQQEGAKIMEGVAVEQVLCRDGKVVGVRTAVGDIRAEYIVNAAGMWARDIGRQVGACVPLHACEHFYIVTEPIAGLSQNLPVLRLPDEHAYYKEDAGKILLGAFEPKAKPWGMRGISDDFCFETLPDDYEHFEPILTMAVKRMPILENAGIQTFFNGPESFTPDDRYLLGETPEVRNFYVIAGFNSVGIQSAGGAGMALAAWMDAGEPPMDLWEVDIRRMMGFQRNRQYLKDRVSETLGLLYADHFPYRQMATARDIRHSPLHERLATRGACFGELAGWERANWFLPMAENGTTATYQYSWKRQNWFEYQAAEHRAVRESVGFFDLSSFGKIRLCGVDAEKTLQHIAAADVAIEPGRMIYSPLLNANGGIEADVTITRLAMDEYIIVTPAATIRRDLAWIQKHIPAQARCLAFDMTVMESTLAIMGPKSREFLQPLIDVSLANVDFPFGGAQAVEISQALGRAQRVSFVGELGWELYVSADMARHVFDALIKRGEEMPLVLCGMHALDSCRIEKAYRHFGHDISGEDHILEAGLGFAVGKNKSSFIGYDAIMRRREQGLRHRLTQFQLLSPQPLLYHHEPIWRDGKIAGYITSGNYGHTLGGAVGLGYVACYDNESVDELLSSRYEIEVAGEKIAAKASARPLYDPSGARMKS